jgi:oligopeptidase B
MQVVHSRQKGLKVNFIPGDERHYVRYSQDKKNWGLMSVGGDQMTLQDWIPVVPSDSRMDIVDVEVFKDFLVLVKRIDGMLQIEVNNLKDQTSHNVPLPQDICEIGLEHNDQFDSSQLRFSYSSPISPESVFLYDMEKKKLKLLKAMNAGGFDPGKYTLERIWAQADDGTQIPITIYHKKGLERDGTSPLYLYAYGSYGITLDPYFSNILASFLERGVFCAIAHVRGGGDLGRQWYAQGSMLKKRNTFTDFINCAEHLINQGYTSSERLAIRGGSAGGLLMGAVLNMRPDLFKACLAEVPFVDVVTTMLDEALPLTTQEWKEWGNPKEKRYYDCQLSYSPYDNTRAQNYPALFVTAGLNDAQVSYHEPAKWVAKLLEYKTNASPLLFRINMGAGHHGSSGRYQVYAEMAPKFAFLLDQIGVHK